MANFMALVAVGGYLNCNSSAHHRCNVITFFLGSTIIVIVGKSKLRSLSLRLGNRWANLDSVSLFESCFLFQISDRKKFKIASSTRTITDLVLNLNTQNSVHYSDKYGDFCQSWAPQCLALFAFLQTGTFQWISMLQGLLVVGIIQDTAHTVLSELLSVGT